MRKVTVYFQELIVQLLPPHRRQPNRVHWLRYLFNLHDLFYPFERWCETQRVLMRVNSQIIVLQGYFRAKYNNRISILAYEQSYPAVSLMSENQLQRIGTTAERQWFGVPLIGEADEDLKDVDFVVSIPPGVSRELIGVEINKFRLANTTYKIIQQ